MDPQRLKTVGLQFARALQIAVRTSRMLSTDHNVAAGPIQESYNLLHSILKEQRAFTFGFADDRILLDNVLTTARGLNQLEDDFLKRGISALKFEAGLSLARYKAVLSLLATPLKNIQEIGGTEPFLARQEIEGVRIFPAGKTQKRTASGDTVLEMDIEAYLRAQQGEEDRVGAAFLGMGGPRGVDPSLTSGPEGILARVTPMIEAALSGVEGEPEQVYLSLAHMLQEVRPDVVLAAFPAARREQIQALPAREMAAELMQSRAMNWAAQQLAS